MADPIRVYDLGEGGVNVDKTPLRTANNETLESQNATYDSTQRRLGGLSKRPGLNRFNTNVLGGVVLGGIAMPVAGQGGSPSAPFSIPDTDLLDSVNPQAGGNVAQVTTISSDEPQFGTGVEFGFGNGVISVGSGGFSPGEFSAPPQDDDIVTFFADEPAGTYRQFVGMSHVQGFVSPFTSGWYLSSDSFANVGMSLSDVALPYDPRDLDGSNSSQLADMQPDSNNEFQGKPSAVFNNIFIEADNDY